MRILFVADGRSPIARNWISYFIQPAHEIHLISTSSSPPLEGLASLQVLPVAFSGAGLQNKGDEVVKGGGLGALRRLAPMKLRTFIRQWLGPLTFPKTVRKLQAAIQAVQPDLVHAMRYPYEGIITALARPDAPLLVSVWGNDFTLHAASNPLVGRYTRQALLVTDALHTDCQRDLRLAHEMGFPHQRPAVVLPGSGGIKSDIFYPSDKPLPDSPPVVIQPRGFRTYIRNDVFFQAIPLVLEKVPETRFVCPAMAHEPQAHKWVAQYGIAGSVELLPLVTHQAMGDLFRQGQIVLSPATHDGTPNTLLEAMACGCFPVAGNIESIREWIMTGENGLLFDPADPQSLANAILHAIEDSALRAQARQINQQLVQTRAAYAPVMAQAAAFYTQIVEATDA